MRNSPFRESLHHSLRLATRSDHEIIDNTLSALDLSDRGDYDVFLRIHQLALATLVAAWREEDQADFEGMTHALQQDLAASGIRPSKATPSSSHGTSKCLYRWGVGYVIRGSRLGSLLLRKRVPAGFATAYLDFKLSLAWPQFLVQLDADPCVREPRGLAEVIEGARMAFGTFSAVAQNRVRIPDEF